MKQIGISKLIQTDKGEIEPLIDLHLILEKIAGIYFLEIAKIGEALSHKIRIV